MKTKAHLVFPSEVLREVDDIAGKRRRSLFIVEATQEKLERERFLKALEETKGAWTDSRHPELKTKRDLERFCQREEGLLPEKDSRVDPWVNSSWIRISSSGTSEVGMKLPGC